MCRIGAASTSTVHSSGAGSFGIVKGIYYRRKFKNKKYVLINFDTKGSQLMVTHAVQSYLRAMMHGA